jgi:predicted nucleic acid-binding protein
MDEYHRVLFRDKFDFPKPEVEKFIRYVEKSAFWSLGTPLRQGLPDPDDQPFLEVALSAQVPLVTGNIKDFPASHRQGVHVLSPSDFLKTLTDK